MNTMDITAEPAADYAIATEGKRYPERRHCSWSSDYDCGCYSCSTFTYTTVRAEIDAWNLETAEHRAWIARTTGALLVLANIGRALALVGKMATALPTLAAWAWHVEHEVPQKGRSYMVVGKLGRAKAFVGQVGIAKWFGEESSGPSWARKSTQRIGLQVAGQAKLVYVAWTQVAIVSKTAAEHAADIEAKIVKAAIAPLRARWTGQIARGKKGAKVTNAWAVTGPNAGACGVAMWLDEGKGRMGIRVAGQSEIAWCSVYDVRSEAPTGTPATREDIAIAERIAADAALDEDFDGARHILASAHIAPAMV